MSPELSSEEAINKIIKASSKETKKVSEIKQDIIDVLSSANPKEHKKILNGVIDRYDTSSSFIEKKNLSFVSPFIASIIQKGNENDILGTIYPIKEKDSSGNYEVYKYQVKYGGFTKDIIKLYSKQIGGSTEGLKITDEKGIPYPKDKKFTKGDIVYIKAPIATGKVLLIREKDSSGNYKVYKYKVVTGGYPKHIRNKYAEQVGGSTDELKITDEKGMPYPENKKFTKGDIVYIKAPIDSLKGLDEDTKEKISIQQDYIDLQSDSHKELLRKFNKQSPMKKDIELSFGIPVKSYEDIDKTLSSLTTEQSINPGRYEIVLLLNRPNNKTEFDKKTKEKILKFKLKHPEYNIVVFEHTFDFTDNVKMGTIYKLLGDIIVYRNIQRKNIKGVDFKKIRNLVMKTGGADSTDKHPNYVAHHIEQHNKTYGGKELIRLTSESRISAQLAQAYPLLEIDEFFQRHYDLAYAGGDPLKRDVGIGSYKAWAYAYSDGFNGDLKASEDVNLVKRLKKTRKEKFDKVTMHYDSDFIGAVDKSTDRGIYKMTKGIAYCDRYNESFDKKDKTKDIEWNQWALDNKGKECTKCLELTTSNLERDISAFYRQRINNVFTNRTRSNKYNKRKESSEYEKASQQERANWIAKHIVIPLMEGVLQMKDFMGLQPGDYKFGPVKAEEYEDKNGKHRHIKSAEVHFSESAISKIKQAQKRRINSGYYNYRN